MRQSSARVKHASSTTWDATQARWTCDAHRRAEQATAHTASHAMAQRTQRTSLRRTHGCRTISVGSKQIRFTTIDTGQGGTQRKRRARGKCDERTAARTGRCSVVRSRRTLHCQRSTSIQAHGTALSDERHLWLWRTGRPFNARRTGDRALRTDNRQSRLRRCCGIEIEKRELS